MRKINLIITLEVQDGENRYNIHSPNTLDIDEVKEIKEQVNEFSENLAQEFFSQTNPEPNGEWYEIEGGSRAIRYKSFEIVSNDEFGLFERVLFK